MSTTTITRESTAPETVHHRSGYELWREAQPPHVGKHRGQPAIEDDPQHVHSTGRRAAY